MNPYFRTPPIVKNLLIINILAYMATAMIPAVNVFFGTYGSLFWVGSPLFHTYQFITYMFLHGSLGHLFFNMFALWMFGRMLEYELGPQRFLTYYIVCGVGAALFQMGVAWLTGDTYFSLIGASGAVMGLLLAFGMMHPNERIFVFPLPFPIAAKWFVAGYAVIEILLGVTGRSASIAHFAHIGGMLWGLALLMYWKKRRKIRF